MMNRLKLSLLIFSMMFGFSIFLAGCSPDEGEKTPEETAPVMEQPGEETQPEAPVEKPEKPKPEEKAMPSQQGQMEGGGETPPDEIVLKPDLWDSLTRAPVKFTHEKHVQDYTIECKDCHHVYQDGKNVWDPSMPADKCQTCHDEPTVKGETQLPPEEKKRNLKLAFHNNCRSCHKDVKKDDPETTAPVSCSQCHPREE